VSTVLAITTCSTSGSQEVADLKVKAGDPVSAKAWNQVIDLLPVSSAGFGSSLNAIPQLLITIKNVSGAARDIGEILTLGDWDGATDATEPYTVIGSSAWEADVISWPTGSGKVCVVAEPIPDDERGLAVIYGPCLVKMKASETDTNKPYVFFDVSDPKQCVTADAGIARILHKFASEDYAVVVMGDRQMFFRYALTQDSQAPSATTATLKTMTGTAITNASVSIDDPLSWMADQVSGDEGLCYMSGDKFQALQAVCL